MHKLLVLFAALLLFAEISPAWAASPRQQANAIFRRGRQLYSKGRLVPALKQFRRAQRLYPSYKIELSIAYTLEALKRPAEAAHYLERSLSNAQGQAPRRVVADAKRRLRKLQQKVASVSVEGAPPGAAVKVNGEPQGEAPLRQRIYLPPGSYALVVEDSAGELLVSRSVRLGQGQHYLLEVPSAQAAGEAGGGLPNPVLQPELEAPSQDPVIVVTNPSSPMVEEPPFYKTWWFWTASAAVVGVAVGVVLATQLGGDDRLPQGSMGTIYLDR